MFIYSFSECLFLKSVSKRGHSCKVLPLHVDVPHPRNLKGESSLFWNHVLALSGSSHVKRLT